MKKRILSLLLTGILLLASFPLSASAGNAESINADAQLLCALGVTDSAVLSDTGVTRAQFVRYAMKLADIPVSPYTGTPFADVPATHVDYGFIMSAVDFGLISIADNFRPDDEIAPYEAVKIIVSLLGYDFMAAEKGGYPAGYLQTALSVDLLDGVELSGSMVTGYDACALLSNALRVKLPEVTYSDLGAVQYTIASATILSKYRNVVQVEGLVNGVSHYADFSADGVGEGNISIDGVIYRTGDANYDSLFGYEVEAYYHSGLNRLIHCAPADSNRVLSVYADDIDSFRDGTYTYTDINSNTRTANVTRDTVIFYNGKLFDYNSAKMTPESGSLTFVSQGSGAYSVLYITSYTTIAVDRIYQSNDELVIVDKHNPSSNNLVVDLSEAELKVTDQNGAAIDISDISNGDVVNAAKSDDGKSVEIICVRDEILGTYSGKGDGYIEINGSSYRLSSGLESRGVDSVISIGDQAVFRLDIDQRVADIAPSADDGASIGYLVVAKLFESGLTSRLVARILNLDGRIYDYDFADRFSISGTDYKDYKSAYTAEKSADYNSLPCSVVLFETNAEGKLTSLVYPDTDGGLYVTHTVESATKYHKYSKYYNAIGSDIICDASLKVFKVPNPIYSVDHVDEEQFGVVTPDYIVNDRATDKKLEGYTTIANDGISKYLVLQAINDEGASSSYALGLAPRMVGEISQVLIDGEPHEAMKLHTESVMVVYSKNQNDFTNAGITPGDIVRVAVDENNTVHDIRLVYKKGSTKLERDADNTSRDYEITSLDETVAEMYIGMAVPYRFRGDVLEVVSPDTDFSQVTSSVLKPRDIRTVKIIKYDEKAKMVTEISRNDLKDYSSFGSDSNMIIYHMNYEKLAIVFLIK